MPCLTDFESETIMAKHYYAVYSKFGCLAPTRDGHLEGYLLVFDNARDRNAWVYEDWGSSPHTRGTPDAEFVAAAQPGIIPAYAGNTSAS